MTKECLACLVNPTAHCLNCNRKYCDPCQKARHLPDMLHNTSRCPERPIYANRDGHYLVKLSQRPHILIGSPAVVKIKSP